MSNESRFLEDRPKETLKYIGCARFNSSSRRYEGKETVIELHKIPYEKEELFLEYPGTYIHLLSLVRRSNKPNSQGLITVNKKLTVAPYDVFEYTEIEVNGSTIWALFHSKKDKLPKAIREFAKTDQEWKLVVAIMKSRGPEFEALARNLEAVQCLS